MCECGSHAPLLWKQNNSILGVSKHLFKPVFPSLIWPWNPFTVKNLYGTPNQILIWEAKKLDHR